jgi:hypothetical protein
MVAFMAEPHTLLIVAQPAESGSPARRLAEAGLQHAAEQHFLDVLGLDAGALHRGPDRRRAEFGRRERGEVAGEAADRGSGGGNDYDRIIHSTLQSRGFRMAQVARTYMVSANSSRPISQRRISDVPAPIS